MTGKGQTIAGAYEKIQDHEDLCALRYKGIEDGMTAFASSLGEVKEQIAWAVRGVWGVVLALIAWALLQVYSLSMEKTKLEAQLVVAAAAKAASDAAPRKP